MDRLAKLIADIDSGLKTKEEGMTALEFLAWEEDTYQNEKQMRTVEKMINGHTYPYGITPEEVVLEKERELEVMQFLSKLSSIITERQRKILWLYVVKNKRQKDIALELDIDKRRVSESISLIIEKAKTITKDIEPFREHLLPPQSTQEPHKPESCGLPFEFLMHQNDGGREGRKYGRKVYISKEKCLIPEYFEQCFGKNHNAICTLCDDCCRRDYFTRSEGKH